MKYSKMNRINLAKILFVLYICIHSNSGVPDLKLVHVLFAHKLYAPWENKAETNEISVPDILSYESFISTRMNIPINAELKIYNLGLYLREIYDEFLNDTYMSEIIKIRTTEHALSILSAQLVNAGLWPPVESQIWIEDFNWQPVPFDYLELKKDTLMLGTLCPNFISQMNEILQTTETQKILTQHQFLFDHLSKYTGKNIRTPSDVALLYAILETMADQNNTLPNWAMDVFPHGAMYNVTLLEYDLLSMTPLQKQLNGGTFLKEMIGNSLKYIAGDISEKRKMMLYSGDARNIIGILKNLNLWSLHIPNEAATLIFELYFDNDTDTYGIKINYYMGIDDMMITLSLPNCTDICPLQTLINITINLIPQNSQSLCGWSNMNSLKTNISKKKEFNSSNYNRFILYEIKSLIFILTLIYIIFKV